MFDERKSTAVPLSTRWEYRNASRNSQLAHHSFIANQILVKGCKNLITRDVHAQEKFVLYAHAPALTCTHGNTHTTAL